SAEGPRCVFARPTSFVVVQAEQYQRHLEPILEFARRRIDGIVRKWQAWRVVSGDGEHRSARQLAHPEPVVKATEFAVQVRERLDELVELFRSPELARMIRRKRIRVVCARRKCRREEGFVPIAPLALDVRAEFGEQGSVRGAPAETG